MIFNSKNWSLQLLDDLELNFDCFSTKKNNARVNQWFNNCKIKAQISSHSALFQKDKYAESARNHGTFQVNKWNFAVPQTKI